MKKKPYADDAEYIEAMMKRFKLVDMRLQYRDIILEAEASSMGYKGFLKRLLEVEEEGKTCRRTELLKKAAGFESVKRLEDIDYSFNPTLDRDRITDLGNLRFIEAGENVLIIGPPGVGKSMIATGIGIKAVEAGYKVMFVNAKDLVDRLHDSMLAGTLKETLEGLGKIPLLIVDELSYGQRYEKNSLIVTTNLPMGRWDELFTGRLAATAILDRLVHHCHTMSITGDSYRVKGPKNSVRSRGGNENCKNTQEQKKEV